MRAHDAFAGERTAVPELTSLFARLVAAEPRARDCRGSRFWRRRSTAPFASAAPSAASPARTVRLDLPRGARRSVHEEARARGISPFAFVLRVFAEVIGSATASDDVIIATAISGRARPEMALPAWSDRGPRAACAAARALPRALAWPARSRMRWPRRGATRGHRAAAAARGRGGPAGPLLLSWFDPAAVATLPSRLAADWGGARPTLRPRPPAPR